jgi:hypothetical protein
MTYSLTLHPLAMKDIADAIEWYDAQSTGLGERFRAEAFEHLRKILDSTPAPNTPGTANPLSASFPSVSTTP